MELSSEILDTLGIVDNKEVMEMEVLQEGEDVIYESEIAEESEEVEIIEIIEEIEEDDETALDNDESKDKDNQANTKDNDITEESDQVTEKDIEMYDFDEVNNSTNNNVRKTDKKQVIKYDVDEDWQDEEFERVEELEDCEIQTQVETRSNKKHVNNQTVTIPMQSNKLDLKLHVQDSTGRSDKLRVDGNDVNMEDNSNTTHQIVKNVENNLLYTVLGTKKQDSSTKQAQEKPVSREGDTRYIKMERLDENTIPVEGTIYYEGDNMETLYVAQPMGSEQYQYEDATIEQDEQIWETPNPESNQNQEEGDEDTQEQIFLHEGDDGQLYVRNENGSFQQVYMTDDGTYTIAATSDDQEKESQPRSQQNNKTDEDMYIVPDLDHKSNKQSTSIASTSSLQDLDNEDTVTISLIISEDENGQKRTQVIIPTTDNLKCDICCKSFKTSFQLLRHNRLKHAREEDITTRSFPCDLCPKRYPDQTSLARHRKTHTGDRPFQCLECHKNFPTSTALRRHLTLHNSQSRPLPCIYCGRRFMEKASLAKHEQSHMPNEQRIHTCDICQKTFTHVTDLSMHKKYHDPDKKYDCEVCGREFNRLNNLQRHMMVHQQQQGGTEEILSCDVCGITYKFMSSLTRHMVTTHMNPEKLRQQAEEQRRKRENNYRKYLENRKMYETQHPTYSATKRNYHHNARLLSGSNDDTA